MEYRDRHGPDMLNGQVFTNEGLNGHGSLFKGGENLLPGVGSDDSSDGEVEVEVEISTPRLCTSEFDAMRQKYPVAFRRRTSLSSVCSGASSIYSGSMIIGEVRHKVTHKRSKTEGSRSSYNQPGANNGLPPRAPPRNKKQEHSKNQRRTVNDENGHQASGENESSENDGPKISLKERLRRNREEMRALLSKDNLPFKHKLKEETVEEKCSNTSAKSPKISNAFTHALQELNNPSLLHVSRRLSPRTHDGHTLLEHLKAGKRASAKRLKGPTGVIESVPNHQSPSSQASTPGMENGEESLSLSSSHISAPVNENGHQFPSTSHVSTPITGNGEEIEADGNDSIRVSELVEEEIVEPISNARAPKLKSARRRGKSPSPSVRQENVASPNQQLQPPVSDWPLPFHSPSSVFGDDDKDSVRSAPQPRILRSSNGERRRMEYPPPPPPPLRARASSVDGRQQERTHNPQTSTRQPPRQRSSSYTNLPDSDAAPIHRQFLSSQDIRQASSQTGKGPRKLSKHQNTASANREHTAADIVHTVPGIDNSTPVMTKPPKATKLPWKWRSSKKDKKEKPQASTESLLSTIPPPIAQTQAKSNTSDMDNTSEILFRGFADDIDVVKEKKSKLRWKRSKGSYTPNEEFEKKKLHILQSNSRSSSCSSLYSEPAGNGSNSGISASKKKKKGLDLTSLRSRRNSMFS